MPTTGDILKDLQAHQTAEVALSGKLLSELAGPFGISLQHPRFWGRPAEVSDLLAKCATTEGTAIRTAALACAKGGATTGGDRMLCCAFFYRFGSQLGIDAATVASLGATGVSDLMSASIQQGTQDDIGWSGAPWALAYDWLFPLLSPAQLATLQAKAVTVCTTRTGTVWTGYNQRAGDCPMNAALAIFGDVATDYVTQVYQAAWFAPSPPYWDYANQESFWTDGGNEEGWAQYFCSCYHNFGTRGLWEASTTDRSLDFGWFDNAPLYHLFQCIPDTLVKGQWPSGFYTSVFSGGVATYRGLWAILQTCTKFSNPTQQKLARWLIDQTPSGYSAIGRTPGQSLIYGLLIGDPRVQGSDPATLGIPLTLDFAIGERFRRSDWTTTANEFWYANHREGSRITPAGEFALYSKGNYLFGDAAHHIGHSYSAAWLHCGVVFMNSQGIPAFGDYPGGSVPDYKTLGTWQVNGDTIHAECGPDFAQTIGGHCTEDITCDAAVRNIAWTIDVACSGTLTPHLVLPCPTQPVVNADGSISIVNGAASCTLTFDQPVTPIAVGGVDHYADGLPGTAYAGKPYLLSGTQLDSVFDPLQRKTDAASIAATLKQMGWWRLHVPLPAGGGKLTVTIRVQ